MDASFIMVGPGLCRFAALGPTPYVHDEIWTG